MSQLPADQQARLLALIQRCVSEKMWGQLRIRFKDGKLATVAVTEREYLPEYLPETLPRTPNQT